MPIILISINNPRESVSIKQFLLKNHVQVVTCLATYSSYIKALQYEPDMVVSEFLEKSHKEYFTFLKLKNENSLIKDIPHFCYGDECDAEIIEALKISGIPVYLKRPLNEALILAILSKILASKNKSTTPQKVTNTALPSDVDYKRLKDRSVSSDAKLTIMRNHITKLLAFPMTIANILRVTQNEQSGAGDLAVVIRTDSAVSAEILRTVNSVHFSRGTTPISNIKDAIVRIGFLESRKLALSISVYKLSDQKNYSSGFNHTEFWFHSFAVAIIAERIARNSMLVNPEEAFIGGLLHDIGLLLFNEYLNPLFIELLTMSRTENIPFLKCEALTLGTTHNLLMKDLFTEWNFPETLIVGVPFFSRIECLTREHLVKDPLAVIVTIAELITRSLNIGRDTDCSISPIPSQILQMIKLPHGLQKGLIENIYTNLNKFNKSLNIDNRVFPLVEPPGNTSKQKILFCCLSVELYHPVYEYCSNKQYSITLVRTMNELKEKAVECNILILDYVTSEHKDLIKNFETIMVPVNSVDEDPANYDNSNPSRQPLKMMLISKDTQFNADDFNTENVIQLTYPIDVRSIDGILSCFANNYSPKDFISGKADETISTENKSTQGTAATASQNILIAHANNTYRKRLANVVSKIAGLSITEFNPSVSNANLLNFENQSFKVIFLEFSSPEQIIESVETFKRMQKMKPQFVITFNAVKKEDLLPLISKGLTLFLSENDDDESIEKRVFTILSSSL